MSTQAAAAVDSQHEHPDYRARGWFEANSPRHEAEYSGVLSALFHFCFLMILSLIAGLREAHDRLPPSVDVVQVADASAMTGDMSENLPNESGLEATEQPEPAEFPQFEQPQETLKPVDLTKIEANVESATESVQDVVAEQGRQAAAAAAALANLKERLNKPTGGSGKPSGGGGGSGRGGRAARWILRFDTRSPQNYLEQLDGLGAEVAFPENGDRWRYFTNLTAATPESAVRDLSSETRIYWVDQSPQTFRAIGAMFGVRSAPMMVVFLPQELENRLLEMELNYMGPKAEEDIAQTEFIVVERGGKLDVQVESQRLR